VRTLAPLRHRNFRLYFAGEAISSLGNGIGLIALTWYLLDRTGDATAVSLFWGLALGAGLFTLPLGGVVADRYSRRSIAVAADAIGLATMLLLGAIALAGDPPLALVYAVTFLAGVGHALFWPAIVALLQEIIPVDELTEASGLREITFQVGNMTGAALGGPLFEQVGLGWALVLDAATFAASAVALILIRYRPIAAPEHASFRTLVAGGVDYLRRHGAVALFGVVSLVPFVATISLNVVAVAYVADVLERDATTYGVFDMTYSAGAVASGFLAALVVLRFGEWTALASFMLALAAVYAAFALEPTALAPAFALMFLAGFCSSAYRVVSQAVLLRIVPKAVMGRTTAAFLLVSTVLQVAVAFSIGPLIDAGGVGVAFLLLALLVAAGLAVLAATLPSLRRAARGVSADALA
jgi:DHA3 family tetracycline resistance protein-like MFS transporter